MHRPIARPRQRGQRTRHVLAGALTLLVVGATGASASVYGPDASCYQHIDCKDPLKGYTIDWGAAHATSGAAFAFVKATEGTGYTNPYFKQDFAALATQGLMRGAYHFARPSTAAGSAAAQADYFAAAITSATAPALPAQPVPDHPLDKPGDLPPVLDLEDNGGLTPAQLQDWTRAFLTELTVKTNRTPMIYAGPYFWKTSMGNDPSFAGYPLWVASYSDNAPGTSGQPALPAGWTTYTFWQYTDQATMAGFAAPLDMSVFNGTSTALAALANNAPDPGEPQHDKPSRYPVLTTAQLAASLQQYAWTAVANPAKAGPVAAIQQIVGATNDGLFGPMSAAALGTWQAARSLPATGAMNNPTWQAMLASVGVVATPPVPTPPPPPAPAPVPPPAPKPAPAPAPAPKPILVSPLTPFRSTVLRQGSRGPAVQALQRVLRIGADGGFGPGTARALVAWKRSHHLAATAVVDGPTWAALVSATLAPAGSTPQAAPAPATRPSPLSAYKRTVLRVGSRGAAVSAAQRALGLRADGVFGNGTRATVLGFQRSHRLPVTGVVDARTWAALGA